MTQLQTLEYLATQIGEIHFSDLAQDPEYAQYHWMKAINAAISQIKSSKTAQIESMDGYQLAHAQIQEAKQTIINIPDADPILLNVGPTLLDAVQLMLGVDDEENPSL